MLSAEAQRPLSPAVVVARTHRADAATAAVATIAVGPSVRRSSGPSSGAADRGAGEIDRVERADLAGKRVSASATTIPLQVNGTDSTA